MIHSYIFEGYITLLLRSVRSCKMRLPRFRPVTPSPFRERNKDMAVGTEEAGGGGQLPPPPNISSIEKKIYSMAVGTGGGGNILPTKKIKSLKIVIYK